MLKGEGLALIFLSGYRVGTKILPKRASYLFFVQWMMGGILTSWTISGWDIDPYSLCLHVYIIFVYENHSVADVQYLFGSSPSLSLEFCRSLFDREMTDVIAFLSLIGEFKCRPD